MTLPLLLSALLATFVSNWSDSASPRFTTDAVVLERAGDPILRGAPIGNSPVVKLSDVISRPSEFAGRTVIIEGSIRAVCQKKGCWMEITSGEAALRMTFKDYGFFVPKDSKGKVVRAEGLVQVKTLTKADADHLAAEGASIKRNEDGTATEVGFVASGVEIGES
jgi:hypothetical protein